MYKPSFQTSSTMVPILSRAQIEEMAVEILKEYNPDQLVKPQPMDVDRFLEQYLGVDIDFKFLTHCGVYLGMTVFNDSDKVPIYDPVTDRAKYISCKARTVILDNRLLTENQEHRYAFTGAHEGSHVIVHPEYFEMLQERSLQEPSLVQCRGDEIKSGRKPRTDREWIEWQADTLAACLLMPAPAVYKAVAKARYSSLSVNYAQEAIQSNFNVSFAAAAFRCDELNLR